MTLLCKLFRWPLTQASGQQLPTRYPDYSELHKG